MKRCILLVCAITLASVTATDAQAQFRGRGGGFGVGGLLMSEEVRQEVNLSEEQQQELRAMGEETRNEMRERMRTLWEGYREMSEEERNAAREDMRAEMEEMRVEVESRVKKVLKPEQFDRLRQIELQQEVSRRGSSEALSQGRVAEELGITDEQREQLQAKAAEVQQKLNEKIQQLRADAREEILGVLTAEQRAKYDALVGKPFEMPQRDFRRGGGRDRGERGDRGRRGERERRGRPDSGSSESPELE